MEADSQLRCPCLYRPAVPADVQHGRLAHRGQDDRNERAGSGNGDRKHHLPDRRLFHGLFDRSRCGHCAGYRRRGCKGCVAGRPYHGGDGISGYGHYDSARHAVYTGDPRLDGYAGRCISGGLTLSTRLFCRQCGAGLLQPVRRHSAGERRFQAPALLPDLQLGAERSP